MVCSRTGPSFRAECVALICFHWLPRKTLKPKLQEGPVACLCPTAVWSGRWVVGSRRILWPCVSYIAATNSPFASTILWDPVWRAGQQAKFVARKSTPDSSRLTRLPSSWDFGGLLCWGTPIGAQKGSQKQNIHVALHGLPPIAGWRSQVSPGHFSMQTE